MRTRLLLTIVLVVFALGILAAVFLPRLFRAREQNGIIPCDWRLKQVGLALRLYAQDFDGRFPWCLGVADPNEAWRDLALLYPNYEAGWPNFLCPNSKDRRFDPKCASGDKKEHPFEPLLPADNTEVISYAYGIDARDPARPTAWTEEAPATTRLAADKKAGVGLTKRSNHKTDGRNVLYQDGHVKWNAGTQAVDPDEDDDEVGTPGADNYTAWWSDPPFYGE